MHATEFLKNPAAPNVGPIVVTYGAERFLRQQAIQAVVHRVLGDGDDEGSTPTRFDGRNVDIATVLDELRTLSMWGDRRLVLVEEAKDFVSDNRGALEKYLEKPAKKSVLLLDVDSWPKNTRLYKSVAAVGLDLDCGPLSVGDAVKWVTEQAKSVYGKQLMRDAAQLMLELVGPQLGFLTQELAKTAAYVGERPKIEVEDVSTMVGGWKLETTWAMLDALQAGQLPTALEYLDKLLAAGEAGLMLLGGISFSFRKLAQATELARSGKPLRDALIEAGVFANKVGPAEQCLRRLGRVEAERIYRRLIDADASLKGGTRLPERIVLERLLVNLSGNP
ncbi:MAG: DNA polymerase III subunit delta [Planctomycetaceae bacterium]|nr:DNA polymerase III subunit delta [Planctomycetaceae bacterium]